MSAREECDYYTEYEDDYTCPLGFVIVKYFLVIVLVIFFIIIPAIMIYVGISFGFCQDIFSAWLLVGLYIILCYKKVLFIHPFDINIVALWRDPHRKVLYRMKRNNNASKIKHYYWCTNICNHMSSICHNQLCLWMMELYSNDKIFLLNMDILETEN